MATTTLLGGSLRVSGIGQRWQAALSKMSWRGGTGGVEELREGTVYVPEGNFQSRRVTGQKLGEEAPGQSSKE